MSVHIQIFPYAIIFMADYLCERKWRASLILFTNTV